MKNYVLTLLLSLNLGWPIQLLAEQTIYVTDHTKFTLRRGESTGSKIIKMLPTGTELILLNKNTQSGYSKVRTKDGSEGFILSRYTMNKQTNLWFLNQANQQIKLLKSEINQLKLKHKPSKEGAESVSDENDPSMHQACDSLERELIEIRKTSENALQIKSQRNQLQERVITVERELQRLKRENQTLKDSANQDKLLYGGLISLLGVILGVFLPKLNWRRKHSSSWDTF